MRGRVVLRHVSFAVRAEKLNLAKSKIAIPSRKYWIETPTLTSIAELGFVEHGIWRTRGISNGCSFSSLCRTSFYFPWVFDIAGFDHSRKSSVFFSYDWSPVAKMKMYLINFIKVCMGDNGKINSNHRLLSKKVNFSNRRPILWRKAFIFQFFAGVGVYEQNFMLGPCATTKLQIVDHSRSIINFVLITRGIERLQLGGLNYYRQNCSHTPTSELWSETSRLRRNLRTETSKQQSGTS